MRIKSIGLISFISLFVLGFAVLPTIVFALADTENTIINATVAEVITIDSTTDPLAIAVTPNSTDQTGNDTILVSTNAAGGYTLNLEDSDATTTLAKGADNIPAMTTALTCAAAWANDEALVDNEWGFKADAQGDANHYCPILASTGAGNDIATYAGPVTSDSTTVTYAIRVPATKPAGLYTDTVMYTATVNP